MEIFDKFTLVFGRSEVSHGFDSKEDVLGCATAREVGDRVGKTLEDWAGDRVLADLLKGFIEEVARV